MTDGRVHVVDGAMGTMLYGRGVFLNVCYDELNLRQPDLVRDIHREYVRAGRRAARDQHLRRQPAQAGDLRPRRPRPSGSTPPRPRLAREAAGDARRGARRHRAARRPGRAVRRDRRSTRRGAHVRAPGARPARGRGGRLHPRDVQRRRRARAPRSRPCAALTDLPDHRADDRRHRRQDALRHRPGGLRARARGHGRGRHRRQLLGGPARRARGGREAGAGGDASPISAQPNAGLPREVGDRKIYMASPEYMASYARRMVEAGARFVGGCCGTTPEHIRAIVGFVQSVVAPARVRHGHACRRRRPRWRSSRCRSPSARGSAPSWPEGGSSPRSRSCRPRASIRRRCSSRCRQLKAAGVDAVNVPDGPRAQSRMGALLSALHDRARGRARGGGALRLPRPQPARHAVRPARARPRRAPQPAASSPAIRRRWGPTPTPPRSSTSTRSGSPTWSAGSTTGSIPAATRSAQPTQFVDRRRRESRGAGPRARAQALRLEGRGRRRVRDHPAGVRPRRSSSGSSSGSRRSGIPIIAGIWPLVSLRNAEFLANEVPGVVGAGRGRSSGCGWRARGGKEEALAEGVRIAREMLAAVADRVQGVQVSAPLGRVPVALEVLEAAPIEPVASQGYTPPT